MISGKSLLTELKFPLGRILFVGIHNFSLHVNRIFGTNVNFGNLHHNDLTRNADGNIVDGLRSVQNYFTRRYTKRILQLGDLQCQM